MNDDTSARCAKERLSGGQAVSNMKTLTSKSRSTSVSGWTKKARRTGVGDVSGENGILRDAERDKGLQRALTGPRRRQYWQTPIPTGTP